MTRLVRFGMVSRCHVNFSFIGRIMEVSHIMDNDLGFNAFNIVGHCIDFENQLSNVWLHTAARLPLVPYRAQK